MNKEDILNLAKLSRLAIDDTDIEGYQEDFDGILDYINSIKNVETEDYQDQLRPINVNTLRDDDTSYEPNEFTKILLDEAPNREKNYFKVSKVL